MNNKHSIIFSVVLLIIIIFTIFMLNYQDKGEHLTTKVIQNTEDIRLYYYRSIPGLMKAEQLGFVKPIHKTFEIPDTDSSLKIDRIWYNDKNIYIFYHVMNIDKVGYLGGTFSTNDSNEIIEFDPRDYVGTPTEKGVISNNSFYSFLKLSPIMDIDKDKVEKVNFKPTLYMEDLKYSFHAIDIDWEIRNIEEPVEVVDLDTQVEIGENNMKLYKLEAGVSYSRLYFTYTSPNPAIIYELRAHLYTDIGESFAIDNNPIAINKEEGRYYVEMPPFNELPTSFRIQLDSINIIGEDSIHGAIDTKPIIKKNDVQVLDTPIYRVMETDVILKTIQLVGNDVKIELLYDNQEDKDDYLLLEAYHVFNSDQNTLLSNINDDRLIIPNISSIQNNFGQRVESESPLYPRIWCDKNNRIHFVLPLDYWEKSHRIFISIENLTYRININQSIRVELIEK